MGRGRTSARGQSGKQASQQYKEASDITLTDLWGQFIHPCLEFLPSVQWWFDFIICHAANIAEAKCGTHALFLLLWLECMPTDTDMRTILDALLEKRQEALDTLADIDQTIEMVKSLFGKQPAKGRRGRRKKNAVGAKQAILSAVKGAMKPKDIIAGLPSLNPSTIRQTLPKLVKSGELKHDKANRTYSKA